MVTLANQVPQITHEGPCDPLQSTQEGQGKGDLSRLRTPPFLKKEEPECPLGTQKSRLPLQSTYPAPIIPCKSGIHVLFPLPSIP